MFQIAQCLSQILEKFQILPRLLFSSPCEWGRSQCWVCNHFVISTAAYLAIWFLFWKYLIISVTGWTGGESMHSLKTIACWYELCALSNILRCGKKIFQVNILWTSKGKYYHKENEHIIGILIECIIPVSDAGHPFCSPRVRRHHYCALERTLRETTI